ncbi:MAG: formylglycine-generating enzyme family protein [Myxococcales bacterium]|nr:formylglycine-generating enzyme family protein [Myxococcales bacterium]
MTGRLRDRRAVWAPSCMVAVVTPTRPALCQLPNPFDCCNHTDRGGTPRCLGAARRLGPWWSLCAAIVMSACETPGPADAHAQPAVRPAPPAAHPPRTAEPAPPPAGRSSLGPSPGPGQAPAPRAPSTAAPCPAAPEGMACVPGASFVMGVDADAHVCDQPGNNHDRAPTTTPAHRVEVSTFFMDLTEVTNGAYQACVAARDCPRDGPRYRDFSAPTQAITGVSWFSARAFCRAQGKRLPTEAEWELAARGSDERPYPWGDAGPTTCWMAIVPGVTGACAEHRGTWEVGVTAEGASAFGALDMAGNVWEWVDDGFDAYPTSDVTDPRSPILPGGRGVLRGGSWDYSPQSAKTTYRLPYLRRSGHVSVGMRCARDANDDGG